MKYLFLNICIFSALLFTGCEKVIKVNLNETEPRVVIDGWIYDRPGPYAVNISRTTSYFNPEASPRVTDAIVLITDNFGQADTLEQTSPGRYETGHLQGIAGRTYTLTVRTGDETYTAQTYLAPVVPIDSLSFIPSEEGPFGTEGKYLITFYANEPQAEKNWYRFDIYKHIDHLNQDSMMNEKPSEWMITDDTAIKGEIKDLPFFYEFDAGDSASVYMTSLDQAAFDYLVNLQVQLTSDGGMFSPPPANPRSNISNKGLGYFGASGVVYKGVRIRP